MSFVAKAGGFFVVPVAGAVLSRMVTKPTDTLDKVAYKSAVAHAVVAAGAAYLAGHKFHGAMEEFATGGAWGSGISAGFLAAAPTLMPELKNRTASSLPTLDRAGLPGASSNISKLVKLLTSAQI